MSFVTKSEEGGRGGGEKGEREGGIEGGEGEERREGDGRGEVHTVYYYSYPYNSRECCLPKRERTHTNQHKPTKVTQIKRGNLN